MSECEPLSRPTWVLGVILRKEAPFFMPEIVLLNHPLFIVDHTNKLCFTTELSDFKAAGLPRVFHGFSVSPQLGLDMLASTCYSEFVAAALSTSRICHGTSTSEMYRTRQFPFHSSTMIHLFHIFHRFLSPSCMTFHPIIYHFTTSFHGYK